MPSKLRSPEELRLNVKGIEIDPPQAFRTLENDGVDLKVLMPNYENSDQALVIGSQIAEFAADVPSDLRPQISNSFLLAQLAANKAMKKSGGGTREWFAKYIDVLISIGWVGEGTAEAVHEVCGDTMQAHKEIVTVLTSALGPTAAAASIVLAALKGLKEMSKNSPWITVFDRQSQTRTVQQFQIAYVKAEGRAAPEIFLVCFDLSASASVTQILFFRFSSSDAKLHHRQIKLSMNETVFEAVKDVVKAKLVDHVSSLIRAINL